MLRAHPLGVFNQFAANNVRRNVRNDVDANALDHQCGRPLNRLGGQSLRPDWC